MAEPLYARWDVVRVPYPFTESEGEKRRPALVVNNKALVSEHRLYWLIMITSAGAPNWTGDVMIGNLLAAGLTVASIVRTAKIATLQEDRILGRLGHLAAKETASVQKMLMKWLG